MPVRRANRRFLPGTESIKLIRYFEGEESIGG